MKTNMPKTLQGKVIRPAMLEIGVADAQQLATTVAFYQALLGQTNQPFRLTTDMALLCIATEDGSSHTTIYWEVPGQSAGLKAAYEDLIKNHGCGGIKPPYKPKSTLQQEKGALEICTLADPAGNVLGLVVNPSYPMI